MPADVVMVDGPVLGLETSGRLTGAALVIRGRLAAESCVDARASSQEILMDLTLRILESHGLRVRNLERIGVSVGPGSFTGLRVGLAAARGLALGAGIPVAAIPSHEAMAWPWCGLRRRLVLMTGLRRGELYLEAGTWHEEKWVPEIPGAGVPLGDVGSMLAALPDTGRPSLFLGEAVTGVLEALPALNSMGEALTDPLASARRPAPVALLAGRSSQAATRPDDPGALLPLYLRQADARRPAPPA